MGQFNPESFLNPISSESPCGVNLEEDAGFAELENAAKFIGERQMGDTIIPAVEPDWRKVKDLAVALLARSKDIQIAMHLTCALLRLEGLPGFADGLALLRGYLEQYWQDVFPQQDPEDDYPMLRVNTLSTLKDPKILDPILKSKLTQSKIGEFSWREIEIARGNLKVSENSEESPDAGLMEAAFQDTPFEQLKTNRKLVNQILGHVQAIIGVTVKECDAVNAPDLSPLINLLRNIDNFLLEQIQSRPEAENEEVEGFGTPQKPAAKLSLDGIKSREDVIKALDAICKYFEKYEPSSPIPFLMQRAKKLSTMNFMDILKDMAPDAVNQAENICGVQQKDKQ